MHSLGMWYISKAYMEKENSVQFSENETKPNHLDEFAFDTVGSVGQLWTSCSFEGQKIEHTLVLSASAC